MDTQVKAKSKFPHIGKKRRTIRTIMSLFSIFLIIVSTLTVFTPYPVSYLTRFMFRNGVAVAPANYETISSKIETLKDITYPSAYKSNIADVYLPRDVIEPYPVVLWVHGGAFVGGDKRDTEIYATALAAEGYAVVSINYELAPESKYPSPVIQMGEAYLWLESAAAKYGFDTGRIVLAGDSGGAHIAAQFAAIQSNSNYAKEMGIDQLAQIGKIKAMLLFCAPFDVSAITATDSAILNFLMGKLAWAYFGVSNWSELFEYQATISNHLTSKFPPTFISDGNSGSFESHARVFAEDLRKNSVEVETYFIPRDFEVTPHEYQFVMNTVAGAESFQKTLDFLNNSVF